ILNLPQGQSHTVMPLLQHDVCPFLFSALNFPIQIMCQRLQALYIIAGEIST
ncbi:unnamed protein product, partial [Rangifer tarandus platyrhynchus]